MIKPKKLKRAKEELSTVMKNFVGRKRYVSKHFCPHRFRVDTDGEAARLEFEISPRKRITLAEWTGKILTFMPEWKTRRKNQRFWDKQRRLEGEAYDILFDDGAGVIDSEGMLPIIIKAVVTSVQKLNRAWDYDMEQILAPGRDDEFGNGAKWVYNYFAGGGPWWGDDEGLIGPYPTKLYYGEYPYIVDVDQMRVLRPNMAAHFLGEQNIYRKRLFFDALDALVGWFPGARPIPDNVEKAFNDAKRLIEVGKEICLRARRDRLQIPDCGAPTVIVEPEIAELLADSKDDVVKQGCCEILDEYDKYIDTHKIPEELRESVAREFLGYKMDKATGKA